MQDEKNQTTVEKGRWWPLKAALCLVLALACAWGAFGVARMLERRQGAEELRETIETAAVRCYAVEGAFPASLAYLQQHYGLVINDSDYVVSYYRYADNVSPNVVVVPR